MSAVQPSPPARPSPAELPQLWHEDAPRHFDLALPWWSKLLLVTLATAIAYFWLDFRIAHWALTTHPIPDMADPLAPRWGDVGRELMLLEQWGQWVCSVVVIAAVALIDKKGRRRALAIAIACLATVAISYLLKDLCGRSRPYVARSLHWTLGTWKWAGPAAGFHRGGAWQSFPSSHTTGAFALSVALSWFYPRARGLFIALATITAVQRILHSMHFVSDVLAGMGIAVLVTRATLHHKLPGRVIALMPPALRDWFLQDAAE